MTPTRFVLSLTLLVTAIGCQKNRTEIVLGMATDLNASTPLSSVELQVYSLPDDVLIADQQLPISGTINEVYELPGTYAVYSASGSADRFRALLTATDNNSKTLVVRSAVLSLVPGKTLFARLGMVSACEGMTDCGTGQTCIEGHCASEDIDSSRLPEYTPGMENEVDCASGTTFVDTSTKQPLKVTGTSCGAGTCLEGVCLAPLPADAGTHDAGTNQDAGPSCSTDSGGGAGVTGTIVATDVSVGWLFACAVATGSGVACWGENADGLLGNNCAAASSAVPVPITGFIGGLTAVSVGFETACAITSGGAVECWGGNTSGTLGNNSTMSSALPVQVTGLTSGATDVSVGELSACAVIAGGGVECWGDNSSGQLGNNSTTESHVPVPVMGLTSGAKAVSTSSADGAGNVSCAITSAGAVMCWGYNGSGQLGNGSTTDSHIPVQVSGLTSGVTAISVGAGFLEDVSACAITTGGGVMCWGENIVGELGNNSTADSHVPVQVSGLTSGVTAISVGDHFACAVTSAGGVVCWGNNDSGQLGNNSTTSSSIPVQAKGLTSGAIAVSAGEASACAVLAGGGVSCWGGNSEGELGNNSKTDSSIPVHVVGTGAAAYTSTAAFGATHLNAPQNIFIEPATQNILVAGFAGSVVELDSGGNYLKTFGTSGNGKLVEASGVTEDLSGNIYVGDYGANTIVKFDNGGNYLNTFTGVVGAVTFVEPAAVAADAAGNIWIANDGASQVVELDDSGNLLGQFSTAAAAQGGLAGTVGLALDATGNIWVAQYYYHAVAEYSPAGALLNQYGSYGTTQAPGVFSEPYAVAVDSKGRIFVADTANNDVQILDAAGNFTGILTTTSTGALSGPSGVAIDKNGLVYVSDGANVIHVFAPSP